MTLKSKCAKLLNENSQLGGWLFESIRVGYDGLYVPSIISLPGLNFNI